MAEQHVYRIIFHNQGSIYELYARQVNQGHLYTFVEVADLIFGERSSVVVDPSEEKLKSEFAGVTRTYIPLHAVVRIDEVEKEGTNRIHSDGGNNVTPFPGSPVPPPGGNQ